MTHEHGGKWRSRWRAVSLLALASIAHVCVGDVLRSPARAQSDEPVVDDGHRTTESPERRGDRVRRTGPRADARGAAHDVEATEVTSTPLPAEILEDVAPTRHKPFRFSLFVGASPPDGLALCAEVGRTDEECDGYQTDGGWHLGFHATVQFPVFRELLFVGGGAELTYAGMYLDSEEYSDPDDADGASAAHLLRPAFLAEVEYRPLPTLMVMVGIGLSVDPVVNADELLYELDDRVESAHADGLVHGRFDLTLGAGRSVQGLFRISIGTFKTFSLGARF